MDIPLAVIRAYHLPSFLLASPPAANDTTLPTLHVETLCTWGTIVHNVQGNDIASCKHRILYIFCDSDCGLKYEAHRGETRKGFK